MAQRRTPIAPCKLCKRRRKLCRSHIIPDFVYRRLLRGADGRFSIVTISEQSSRPKQEGEWEFLLCRECEDRFQEYERYAAQVFFEGPITTSLEPANKGIAHVEYERFKLFSMSVFWRAAVSSRPLFKRVVLPPEHKERLRRMLLDGDPGRPEDFGSVVMAMVYEREVVADLITEPTVTQVESTPTFRFVFLGCGWLFFVPEIPPGLRPAALQKDGALPIAFLPDATQNFFQTLLPRLPQVPKRS